jgi:hypothetical protein
MPSTTLETRPSTPAAVPDRHERWRRVWTFWEWCLGREISRIKPYLLLVLALAMTGVFSAGFLSEGWQPGRGRDLMKLLLCFATFAIFAGAVGHAAQAITWETGRDQRDLTRLTGLGSGALLWCKTLARWWTVALSLFLLAPFALFAVTLGGVTGDQLVAGGLWLLMFAVLMSGLAQLAAVSANDTDNTAATLGFVTWGFLVLYHIPFGATAAVVWFINQRLTWQLGSFAPRTSWQAIVDYSIQLMPVTGLYRAITSPSTFSALDPKYWIHLLSALGCYWVASVALAGRFIPNDGDPFTRAEPSPAETVGAAIKRPRCGNWPFFWKDAYVLAGSLGNRRMWTGVYVFAAIGTLLASFRLDPDSGWRLALGIQAECYVPIVIAMRFDVLLAAEFKQQTWSGLVLLPIDRRVLLGSKLLAVFSEQRWVLLPVGMAASLGAQQQPTAILMVTVIGVLVGVLLCQMSALNHLRPKTWWIGPTQAFVAVGLIALCLGVWLANEPWVSFMLTVGVLLVAILPVQWLLDHLLREWTEG